jgi:Uma2 family endonuclease
MATPIIYLADEIVYPDSDGRPVAESDFQLVPLIYALDALKAHFQNRPDVYVAGNMFLYYEEGNPRAVVAPDVFVVIGAPKGDRHSYRLWKEPKAPDFVLEITSKSTRSEDQGVKRGVYAFLEVKEYWQYDPTGDYLKPPLKGFRLVGENYGFLPAGIAEGGKLAIHSEVLGLDVRMENNQLRFYDPITRRKLLNYQELEQTRREAEEKLRQETAARQALAARLAELEAQLRRQEGEGSG